MPKGAMPVLVGVGQVTDHWDGTAGPDGAPSPKSLCIDASKIALTDAGIEASEIDTLAVVRIFEDSVPGVTAATAAGMRVFAFAEDPSCDRNAMTAAGGILFDRMAELPDLLFSNS